MTFKAGKKYKFNAVAWQEENPNLRRPLNWNSEGEMDEALTGQTFVCTRSSESMPSFEGLHAWDWTDAKTYWEEVGDPKLMRQDDMPEWLLSLIYERYKLNPTCEDIECGDTVMRLFIWIETPEGQEFWSKVNRWQREELNILPHQPKGNDYIWALNQMNAGEMVRCKSWRNPTFYIHAPDGSIVDKDGDAFNDLEDFLSTNWETV